jgi:hypothetical protein
MATPTARCPLRPGDPCTLCQLDVTGPADCPLVYLVVTDTELRDGAAQRRREHAQHRAEVR